MVSGPRPAGERRHRRICAHDIAHADSDDRAALVVLYNATDGDNWVNTANWLSNEPLGRWYGVTADGNGRVTRLRLGANRLSGELPEDLGNLESLESLGLPANQLSGGIPAELGNLANLHRLDLDVNQLSGEIPARLGGLASLESLSLIGNQLSGQIPPELGNLSNLEFLGLFGNQLSGEIPAELGNLSKLRQLWLDDNQLSGEIPAELGSLTNLENLLLSGNQLTGCIPAAWRDVPSNDFADLGLSFCPDPLLARYDPNKNGIERGEIIAAIRDYLQREEGITRADLIRLIGLYLSAPSTPHKRPGAPEGLTAAGNGQTRMDLSWSAPPSDGGAAITGYRIEVSENGSTWIDLVANTRNADTSYSHTGLTAGSTRHYRVSAINSAGTGTASNIATGTTATGTTADDATTDRAALAALYNATEGADWRNNGNWLSNAPMGEWHGVTTDSDGRVSELDLSHNELSGEIPAELGNLTILKWLYLDYNQLTGEIPAELTNLTNLEELFLRNNQLIGCIPGGLRDVPRNDLDQLGLDYCMLERTRPDLVASVTSVGDAGILYVGEPFTINAEVYNQGTGPAASTTLRYYRSTDSTISTSDTPVGTDPVRSLEVSGSSPESISRTAPSSAGTYYYGVCVDSVAGESDTRNNCSRAYRAVVRERTRPDLVASVTSVGDAGILYVGEPFTINAEVYNQGTGPAASTTLRYYRSTDSTISTSDTPVGTDPVRSLEVSGSSPESISRTAPSSAGTYYYGVCVDSVAGESDTRNNCSRAYRAVVRERTRPDLVASVTSVGDAGILYVGEPFTINAEVYNQGTGPAASTTLRYYRSTDSTISTSDTPVGTDPVRSLEVSGSSPESISRTAPSSAGTYYYGVCVDSVAGESDTRNNCSRAYRAVVRERTRPDLVASVTSVGDAGILYVGEPFTINAEVYNQGTGPAASTTLRYYRSTDSTISTSDTPVGTDPVRSLEVSGSSPESISRTAPSSAGTYYYGVCVDSVAGESDTRNNCSRAYRAVVRERTRPDLVASVTSVGDAGILYVGEPFTINAEVYNQGTGPAASTTLRYYRSTDSTISTSDTPVGTDPVRSLEVSGSSPESISRTAPSSAGTYYYGVCVDSVAGESDTRNNCSEGFSTAVREPAYVVTIECRATLLGIRYTIEGTVYAITELSNLTVIGYGVDDFGQRTKVGEDDLGTMSAQTSEDFSISGLRRLYTSCEYSLEWEY